MSEMNPKVLWGILAVAAVITAILAITSRGESPEEKRKRELDEKLENIQRRLDDIQRRSDDLNAAPDYP